MSTINKILKTAALMGFVDGGFACMATYEKNFEEFNQFFGILTALTTLPALVTVGVDKFVNQNITSNKIIQYGLTTVESYALVSNFFNDIFITTFIICKSLAFKYIWDSNDETPELNPDIEQQADLIEIV